MTVGPVPQCTACSRFRTARDLIGPSFCEAFPAGIPAEIWGNELDHRQPIAGDNGLQFTARAGAEFPAFAFTLPPEPPDGATDSADQSTLAMVSAANIDPTTGEPHTGAMIALVPTGDYAAETAVTGGEPADQLHCTLLYLGEAADLDDGDRIALQEFTQSMANSQPPIVVEAAGLATFHPGEENACVVLLVQGDDDMRTLQAEIELSCADVAPPNDYPVWIPHITLAYVPDAAAWVAGLIDRVKVPIEFDRLRLALGAEVFDYPLNPDPPAPVDLDEFQPLSEPLPVEVASTWRREAWDGCPRCFRPIHEGVCGAQPLV